MKKVLFIANIGKTPPTGSFFFASLEGAKRCGLEFHVAYNWLEHTPEQVEQAKKEGAIFHQIDFIHNPFHPGNYKAYRQLLELMRREQFDIVHCNTALGGVIGRLCAKRVHCPNVVFMAHGFVYYKGAPLLQRTVFKWIERSFAHMTDVQITINRQDFAYAQTMHLKQGGRVEYVHGVGTDLTQVKKSGAEENLALRHELGLPEDAIVAITTGELNWNKNTITAIRAVAKANQPKLYLLSCGVGAKETELNEQARALGIGERVRLLGYRSDVPRLLSMADIFIFPSYCEGLSRSLMEGMAFGLPCLASVNRGNADLMDDGKGGYLYQPTDADGFAKGFSALCEQPQLRAQFGAYNKEKIKEFALPVVIEEMRGVYERILQHSSDGEKEGA